MDLSAWETCSHPLNNGLVPHHRALTCSQLFYHFLGLVLACSCLCSDFFFDVLWKQTSSRLAKLQRTWCQCCTFILIPSSYVCWCALLLLLEFLIERFLRSQRLGSEYLFNVRILRCPPFFRTLNLSSMSQKIIWFSVPDLKSFLDISGDSSGNSESYSSFLHSFGGDWMAA